MKVPTMSSSFQKLGLNSQDSRLMGVVVISTVLAVFCLVSTKVLLSQASYQRRVINARNQTVKQLEDNKTAVDILMKQYKVFTGANPNFLGGKNDPNTTATPPDGDNARLVLDALPSKYDFPALISSIAKILTNDQISNPSVSGTDASATSVNDPSPKPSATAIPLSVNGSSSYAGIQTLVKDFERSIRPFDVSNLQLSGNNTTMFLSLTLNTYYQVGRTFTTTTQEVR